MISLSTPYYVKGNATEDALSTEFASGWFVGQFVPSELGLRSTKDLEVKWGRHATGEQKKTTGTNNMSATLTLLVSGKFMMWLGELEVPLALESPGDYVIFAPGVRHRWMALTEAIVVTIRWPSVPFAPDQDQRHEYVNVEALALLKGICAAHRGNDAGIMQGVDGEEGHAVEVLNWVGRLCPNASISLRLAAIFHDVDRIVTPGKGGGFKGDRTSQAYHDHKKQHAMRSVDFIMPLLRRHGLKAGIIERAAFLIAHHDDPGKEVETLNDPELDVLVTADTFAFFTTIGPRLLAAEGSERTKDKIRFMIEKSPCATRDLLAAQTFGNDVLDRLKNEVVLEMRSQDGMHIPTGQG